MRDFRYCLEQCELSDLGCVGNKFTWSNKQSGECNIQARLDRGLANPLWQSKFPQTVVRHLPRILSDHCPILVDWAPHSCGFNPRVKVKLFRFKAYWLHAKEVFDVVRRSWGAGGVDVGDFRERIDWCGRALENWSEVQFGSLPKSIKSCTKELDKLQHLPQTQDVVQASRSLENQISALLRKEELFWYQRSRVN
ncbi:hypothetical protein ACS0TY_015627 [Phlomoides rotata]